MNPYMDKILEDAGSYAVYGKALGDKMRKDVEYGTDPWKKASGAIPEIAGVDRNFSSRSARIEELNRQIAELESKLKGRDVESEMGKYKFVFDADPSAYMNHQQSLRNAKATDDIRKANEAAADKQRVIDAWKQNSMDLEASRYSVASAQNKYDEAKSARNTKAMKEAGVELSRQKAAYKRLQDENAALRAKAAPWLFGESVKAAPAGAPGGDLQLDDETNRDIASSEAFQNKLTEISRIDSAVDNMRIPKKQKNAYVKETGEKLDSFEAEVKNSDMLESDKRELLNLIDEKRKQLRGYSKPADKGGQGTTYVKGTLAKEMSGKTRAQLEKYSDSQLKTAYKEGLREKNFIEVLDKKGIPHD